MKENILKGNLPEFENYSLVQLRSKDWESIYRVTKGELYSVQDLYIKGTKRINNKNDKISVEDFFKDYLKFGEDLFNLIVSKSIIFSQNVDITNTPYLKSFFIEKNIIEILKNLTEYEKKLSDILIDYQELLIDFSDYTELGLYCTSDIFNTCISNIYTLAFITRVFENQDSLFPTYVIEKKCEKIVENCYDEIAYAISPIWRELENTRTYDRILDDPNIPLELTNSMDYIFTSIKNKVEREKISNVAFETIDKVKPILINFVKETTELIKKTDFEDYIKKEVSNSKIKSLNKVTTTQCRTYAKEPPFSPNFGKNKEEVKKIILNFIKKYGFPYYVNKDIEKEYHEFIKQELASEGIGLQDYEEIIPCETLVVNSIFNYMYYSAFTKWDNCDKKILNSFAFCYRTDKSKTNRINRKHIVDLKNAYRYYNNHVFLNCSNFDFNCKSVTYEVTGEDGNDNRFIKEEVDGKKYEEKFNNLCIAINKLIDDKTSFFNTTNNTKIKICPTCKKEFNVTSKNKVYCSEDCKNQGKRDKDAKRKREKRKNEKNEKKS